MKFVRRRQNIHILCGLLCLLIVVLDQAFKLFIINHLNSHVPLPIFPGFNLTLLFNTGISFSMLSTHSPSLLITLSVFCITLLVYAYIKFNDEVEKIFLASLIGGSIGNLIDRFVYGAVVDFIDLYSPEIVVRWFSKLGITTSLTLVHFPAFNVADSVIFVSTVSLIFYNLFKK